MLDPEPLRALPKVVKHRRNYEINDPAPSSEAAADGQSFEISTVGQLEEGDSIFLPTDAVRLLR